MLPNHRKEVTCGMNPKQTLALYLVIGLVIGFGIGFMTPSLMPPAQSTLVAEIQARGTIIVGTSSGWPPFEMYNSTTSEFYGFDIDLCDMIADHLGVTVEWVDMDFDALVGACTGGTIDMIAAAMFVTPERAEVLAHSVSYIRVNEIVVVSENSTLEIADLEDLEGLDVGVQTGTAEDYEISDLIDAGTNILIHRYARPETLFADLDSGALDAVYVDEPVLALYSSLYSLRSIFTLSAPPTALFCRWENPDLLAAMNTVILNAYDDGSLDALVEEWFG